MKIEANIDKKLLKKRIQLEYGLEVKKIIFVPKGEVAYSYILDCEVNKYFLKIYPKNAHLYDISAININLKLTSLLKEKYGIRTITYPIKTKKGRLKSIFKGLEIIIFNFIDGIDLASRHFTIHETKRLAQLMARIHAIQVESKMLKKFEKEDFSIDYVEKGIKKLLSLAKNNGFKNPPQLKLKRYLASNKKSLLAASEKLKQFRQVAKKEKLNLVITHGDPIASNVMVDKEKNLYLIDWESAKLAPIERDIWFYIEHPIGNFLDEYKRASGINSFNISIIGFYVYNRVLGDLIHWGQRIFDKKTPLEQAEADLEGLLGDCDLRKLEKSLKNMIQIIKKFRIKILKRKDAQLLREIRLKALQDSPNSFGGKYEEEKEKTISYWEELISKNPNKSVIYGVEYNKKIIGTIFCFARKKDSAGFGGMWVDPLHRNKGIASALINKGITWSKKNGFKKITLWNTETNEAAKNLYKKFGFQPTGNKKPLESNEKLQIQELKKIL